MGAIDDALRANARYAERFAHGGLPARPRRGLAVVACMDARLDVFRALGLEPGDAHVIRNAGGVVTEDVLRSLIVSHRPGDRDDVDVPGSSDGGPADRAAAPAGAPRGRLLVRLGRLQPEDDALRRPMSGAPSRLAAPPPATMAARQAAALLEDLARSGATVMDLVRAGQPVEPWRIYPGDYGIFDRRTGCQFYYHSHDDGRDEDGHFHTVRLFPDHTVHIVAISMTPDGWPKALFTVNLWAIGDAWEPPERIKTYARRFRIDRHRGPAALVRFVNLMFRAFQPEIERLQDDALALDARGRVLWLGAHTGLYRSEDGGRSWTKVALPVAHHEPDVISTDGGLRWAPWR